MVIDLALQSPTLTPPDSVYGSMSSSVTGLYFSRLNSSLSVIDHHFIVVSLLLLLLLFLVCIQYAYI